MAIVRKINGVPVGNGTSVTGFTYSSSSNTLTITDSNLNNFSASITAMSGLTIYGALSAGTLSANTVYIPTLAAPVGSTIALGISDTGVITTGATVVSPSAENVKIPVRNNTGVTILEGKAVYVTGATGSYASIGLALADSNVASSMALGLVENDIPNGQNGYVIALGNISNINTSSFFDGDKVYLSSTIAGGLTTTPPSSPNNLMFIGTVIDAHPTLGKILIDTLYTFKLGGLSDVAIISPSENQVLRYDSATQLWKNEDLPSDTFTGGTFSSTTSSSGGTITFKNASGGTVSITGLARPMLYYAEFSGAPNTFPTATGLDAIAIGDGAKASSNNIISIGANAGVSLNTNNQDSIYIGRTAGGNGVTNNSFNAIWMGVFAGYNTQTSNSSIFIGENSGLGHLTSSGSTFIGQHAGNSNNFSGNSFTSRAPNSIYIGNNAGRLNTTNFSGTNNVVIGNNVGVPSGSTNTLNIGGVIWATGLYPTQTGFTSLAAQTTGKVGINLLNPGYELDVNGQIHTNGIARADNRVVSPWVGIDTDISFIFGGVSGIRPQRDPSSNRYSNTAGNQNVITHNIPFSAGSGNATFNVINIGNEITQTGVGSASGITRGIYINPTISAASDFRAIEVVTGRTILDTLSARSITAVTISAATYLNIDFPIKYYAESSTAPTFSPLVSGTGSIAIGDQAQARANNQFSLGTNAGLNSTGNTNALIFGHTAGFGANGSSDAIFIGGSAGRDNTGTTNPINIGVNAGSGSSSSNNSIFIGSNSGRGATGNSNTVSIGNSAGNGAAGSSGNVFIGGSAGINGSGNTNSVMIGTVAGQNSSGNTQSIMIGNRAGLNSTGSSASILIGGNAGQNTNGSGNQIMIGASAGQDTAGALGNTIFIGAQAGQSGHGSSNSVFIGNNAGFQAVGSSTSVFLGSQAGANSNLCTTNIFMGLRAGSGTTSVNNSIILGTNASLPSVSSAMNLGGVIFGRNLNTGGSTPLTGATSTGRIGINVPVPIEALEISGVTKVYGNFSAYTISATTYLNLPAGTVSATLTGGTMSGNTLVLTNNSGQTVNVNGIVNTGTTLTINGVDFDLNANREWLTSQASTGILNYGTGITASTSTSIRIGPMSGYVVDNETDPLNPTFIPVTYSGNNSVPVTSINTGIGSYVLLNSSGVPFFQNTFPTSQERKQNIWLGKIGHPLSAVTFVINEPDFITSPVSQFRDLFQAINYVNGGVYPYANGANMFFNLTSGSVTGKGLNLHNSKLNPDKIQVGPSIPTSFLYRTQTGGTFASTTLISAGTSDVNGTATAIAGLGTQATNQWIFVVPGAGIAVQFGQTIYTTLTDAIAAVGRESFIVFPNLVDNAILIGVLSVTKGATDLTNTAQARFFRADKFGQIIGAQAGISTTTLQAAYDNSVQPQITTTSTGGALQIKGFSSSSGTSLFQGLNSAGTPTFVINEGGGVVVGGSGFSNSTYQMEVCGITKMTKLIVVSATSFGHEHDGAVIIRNPIAGGDIAMGVTTDNTFRIKTNSNGIDVLNGTTELTLGAFSRASVGAFNAPLYFYTAQLERGIIDNNGKLSIGNASIGSTTRFEVSGNTRLVTTGGTTLDVTGNSRFISTQTGTTQTASTVLISSSTQNSLTVIGSGNSNTNPIFSVQGSQGELFSVSDSLVGSLFSVNDISGLPVLEVFSDDTILMGNYLAPALNTTIKILTSAGTNVLYSFPTSAYTGVWVDYTVNQGLNLRAGSLMAVFNTASTQYTEASTNDIGNTSGITFSMAISGSNALLRASGVTSGWTVKSIIRSI